MRVLIVSSEWPTPEHPTSGVFVKQQVDFLRRAGLDVEVFAFHGRRNPLAHLRAWQQLRRERSLRSFDLLHAQFGQSGLVSRPCPIPLVTTFWGSDLHGIVGSNGHYVAVGRMLRSVSESLARASTEVIVVSERLAGLLPLGVAAHVIPGGVDFELFRPIPQSDARTILGLPGGRRIALFAANPRNPVKRYHLAEAAVARVAERWHLDLLPVHTVGHDQIPLYMSAADVLLLTSAHEGSPTVVKEALACNLSVVAVDVGDVRERIENVDGCTVCESDSVEAIAEALEQSLARGRTACGRKAVAELDERRLAQRIIGVYRKALTDARNLSDPVLST